MSQASSNVQECLIRVNKADEKQKEATDLIKATEAHSDMTRHENQELRTRIQALEGESAYL